MPLVRPIPDVTAIARSSLHTARVLRIAADRDGTPAMLSGVSERPWTACERESLATLVRGQS
jgi:hypothetical protein